MGKKLIKDLTLTRIADAIRAKGGATGTMTPMEMPAKIAEIPTGVDTSDATAQESDMAKNKTAYVNGEKVTGTLEEVASGSVATLDWYLPNFSDGNMYITGEASTEQILRRFSNVNAYIAGSQLGDATPADVASGKTFTSAAGLFKTGTGNIISVIQDFSVPQERNITFDRTPGAKGIKLTMKDGVEITVGYYSTTSTNYTQVAALTPNGSSTYKFYVKNNVSKATVTMDNSGFYLTSAITSLQEVSW